MVNRHRGLATNFKLWVRRAIAFAIAWTAVLGSTWVVDLTLDTHLQLSIMSWLVVGLGVMITKDIELPFRRPQAIDVAGAFRSLWWALLWPRFFR